MAKYLALDYGTKRIGVALADTMLLIPSPRPFLLVSLSMMNELVALIQNDDVVTIIVGYPLFPNQQKSEMTLRVLKFVQVIKKRTLCDVVLIDERFSSKFMERELIAADYSRKKRKNTIDSAVACLLLEHYIQQLKQKDIDL